MVHYIDLNDNIHLSFNMKQHEKTRSCSTSECVVLTDEWLKKNT